MDIKKRSINDPITDEEISDFFELAENVGWKEACEYFPNLEFNKPKEEILPLPIHWLDMKLEQNGKLNENESKISY